MYSCVPIFIYMVEEEHQAILEQLVEALQADRDHLQVICTIYIDIFRLRAYHLRTHPDEYS